MNEMTTLDDGFRLRGSVRGRLNKVDLTPERRKKWDETRARFLYNCPAFSHILYELMKVDGQALALFVDNEEIKYAATDGAYLILNPNTFFTEFDAAERTFVIAHEVLHCIFQHCQLNNLLSMRGKIVYSDGVELPYIHEIMNMAEDYIINDMLIESKTGTMPKVGLADKAIGHANESPVDVYRKIYEKAEKNGQISSMGASGFDTCLQPGSGAGTSPDQARMERNDTSWKMGIAQARAIGKAQGDTASSLDRMFGELLEPKISWRDHLQALFSRKIGSGGYDWRRADRRLITREGKLGDPIYAPGRSGNGCGTIVVGVDTSGSIGETILDAFFAEMAGMLEDLRPKRLVIMWCDAEVHRVDELEDVSELHVLRSKGAPGGGGTSFIPVFYEIKALDLEPEALVYLTDGYGLFPHQAPGYHVIWGNISTGVAYPFGDVVDIDLN